MSSNKSYSITHCPFCGHCPTLTHEPKGLLPWVISCENRDCPILFVRHKDSDVDQLLAEWNSRATKVGETTIRDVE